MLHSTQLTVIALDPGVTTGYAEGVVDDGEMKVVTGQAILKHIDLYNQLQLIDPHVVICESFEFRRKVRDNLELYSRELIGVANLFCQVFHRELVIQPPKKDSPTQPFNDKKLKEDHIYKAGKPHANDAARHLLHWFVFGSGFQYNDRGYKSGVMD